MKKKLEHPIVENLTFGTSISKDYVRKSEILLYHTLKEKKEQLNLFHDITQNNTKLRHQTIEHNIHEIGTQLTIGEHYALNAISYLATQQKKFLKPSEKITFTIADYLRAYGINKNVGHGSSREKALKNLYSLERQVLFYFKRKTGKKSNDGQNLYDLIKMVRPILQISKGYKNVKENEIKAILNDTNDIRATHLIIEPVTIFWDWSYILLSQSIMIAIKPHLQQRNESLINFVHVLYMDQKHQKSFQLSYTIEQLAKRIGLDSLLKQRKKSQINIRIQKYIEILNNVNLLTQVSIFEDTIYLTLNSKFFYQKEEEKFLLK